MLICYQNGEFIRNAEGPLLSTETDATPFGQSERRLSLPQRLRPIRRFIIQLQNCNESKSIELIREKGWSGASLPVLVLIHGESYLWGAGHLMDGGQLALSSRLVVVTLNYRLGILGNNNLLIDSLIHF